MWNEGCIFRNAHTLSLNAGAQEHIKPQHTTKGLSGFFIVEALCVFCRVLSVVGDFPLCCADIGVLSSCSLCCAALVFLRPHGF